MRFEGNLSSSDCCGIESLVNLNKLADAGVSIDSSSSVVDHVYFNSSYNPPATLKPLGCASWFKLDNEHLSKYGF